MSADRLRSAASLLRERAEAATPGPWVARGNDVEHFFPVIREFGTIAGAAPPHEAAYIALMHPPVALALADWLMITAEDCGTSSLTFHGALAVADAILGDRA